MVDRVKAVPARRARGSLTRDQIVAAALGLADDHGLESLSMPRLAHTLECGVMTLYRYVLDKDDLLGAMVQLGLADLHLPRPLPDDPAEVMVSWGRALHGTLRTHPSLASVILSRPVVGPGIVDGVEALLRALARCGVGPGVGVQAIYVVLVYTAGFAAWEVPRTGAEASEAYARSWRHLLVDAGPDESPLAFGAADELVKVADQQQFDFGLTHLAQGLFPTEPTAST